MGSKPCWLSQLSHSVHWVSTPHPSTPLKESPSYFFPAIPFKIEVFSSSPLFKNLVGGSTPPHNRKGRGGGGVHTTYPSFSKTIHNDKLCLIFLHLRYERSFFQIVPLEEDFPWNTSYDFLLTTRGCHWKSVPIKRLFPFEIKTGLWMLMWSVFGYHDCACHAGVIKIVVAFSTWTFLKTCPMRQKGERRIPWDFSKIVEGDLFLYCDTWWALKIFLKISRFSFHSLKSATDRNWWSTSTLSVPSNYSTVITIPFARR